MNHFTESDLQRGQEFVDCEVWWIEDGGVPTHGPYVDLNGEVAADNQAETITEVYGPKAELSPDLSIVGPGVSGDDPRLRTYGADVGRSEHLFDEANALALAAQALLTRTSVAMSIHELRAALDEYVGRWQIPPEEST